MDTRLTGNKVLELLKQGKTVKEISMVTGRSIDGIKYHKARLKKLGLWGGKVEGQFPTDLDQVTDILIDRLEKARIVPVLEEQIRMLSNQKAAIEAQYNALKKLEAEKTQRQLRYDAAMRHGEIAQPLVTR